MRVLQAREPSGKPFATLLNFSAHTTVLGSSNRKVSGDWVQSANPLLAERFGGQAVTVVGTVTASARIGDVLLSSMPGEAYPQIPLKVAELVKPQGHMTPGWPTTSWAT